MEDQASQRSSTTYNSTISEVGPLAGSHDQLMNLEEHSCQGLMADFAVDFDMDSDFLSGFFNMDWISELSCAENSGNRSLSESDVYNDIVEGNVNYEQTPVLLPLSSDLESIVSLIETDDHLDNWLQV